MVSGIVVGVDPTAEGLAAVEFAVRQAVSRSLPLIAVRAWADVVTPGHVEHARQSAARLAEDVVGAAVESVPGAHDLEVQARAVPGGPGPALVRAARDMVLLVVGTGSSSALSRVLLGSTTRYVLHHAPCPVAVVPTVTATVPGARVARVVVGVNHSPSSRAALA